MQDPREKRWEVSRPGCWERSPEDLVIAVGDRGVKCQELEWEEFPHTIGFAEILTVL
ncbi:hypothetical protein DSL72_007409 [Monilinia vaccinii-corymbosi]|uniref:Uncharacterized protein n=1 Tax=Monilinia vaccinii-corymbosi TaxID=61207 RepID=A0A8A3PMQ9_9HELO|nr:hypothetical protein DSL72_007409 [Monilinia vaccinii-corymbosi]